MKRKIVTNKLNRKDINKDDFNKLFWNNIAPEKKMIIAWNMVKEVSFFRGGNGESQSRLQRSVQNIKRRER